MNSNSFFSSHNVRRAEQIFRRGGRDTAFALHAFDQDGDGRGRNRVARGGQIIERNVPEARRRRLKTFLDLVLAGRGNARQCASVKGIRRGQNFKPAFVVAELAGELEQSFVGLRAAVGKKAFARAEALDEFGGQPALRLGEIQVRDVDQFARLFDERLGDGRVRVAEAAHGNAGAKVEVTFARDIKQVTARAMAEREVEAAVAGHDVLAEQFPHGLVLAVNERRR